MVLQPPDLFKTMYLRLIYADARLAVRGLRVWKVLIADDIIHPIRSAMKVQLMESNGYEVVAEAANVLIRFSWRASMKLT